MPTWIYWRRSRSSGGWFEQRLADFDVSGTEFRSLVLPRTVVCRVRFMSMLVLASSFRATLGGAAAAVAQALQALQLGC